MDIKKISLGLLFLTSFVPLAVGCHKHDGSCHQGDGPTVSRTFCPTSGCPCTAKICRECEDCPM